MKKSGEERKTMNVKRILSSVFLSLFSILFLSSFVSADCFTVIVGKNASSDGSVLFGHNEQNGGRRIVSYRFVPRLTFKPGTIVSLKNGGALPEVAETYAMIWQQNPGVEFGDSYFNEWGVVIASDSCATREDSYQELVDRGDIQDGGIGYMFRRLIAQRAKTAREGIEIAAGLLERLGYSSSGRSYIIADPDEAWVLSVARGKHWIAQRCPDDEVVLLPNIHIIGPEADLDDTENVMASPGLVDYAVQRGWYDPSLGRPFSFKDAFNRPSRKGSFMDKQGCDPRQWYAQSVVIGKFIELPVTGSLPFSVRPAHKMTVEDVAKILRSHSEGSAFDASDNYRSGSPHLMRGAANICSKGTQEGAVFQLRSGLPKEIGCLVWRTTAAPCSNVLTPWYLGITETPQAYRKEGDVSEALDVSHHFDYPEEKMVYDPDFAFDVFNALENLVDLDYAKAIKIVKEVWDPFEKNQFAVQPYVEKVALDLFEKDKALAKQFLTDYTFSRALLALEKAKALNKKLRTMFWSN
jgi:dipeptidase